MYDNGQATKPARFQSKSVSSRGICVCAKEKDCGRGNMFTKRVSGVCQNLIEISKGKCT